LSSAPEATDHRFRLHNGAALGIDASHQANNEVSAEEKLELFAELICRPGDEPEIRSAALLVLLATIENSTNPKVLANHVKHITFTRCGELNCYGMVDAQVAAIESELLASNPLIT
jgi:hypothetical protein